MSKKKIFIDPRQRALPLERKIAAYQKAKEEILQSITQPTPPRAIESYAEACIQVAAAINRAIRKSGLSREQVVDGINEYFGESKKPLSIHMFNHYLSKPVEYPIDAAYLFPIDRITGSLEPIRCFAEAEDARVISGAEVKELALGKLDETISQMQRLKRELKGRS